MDINRYNTRVRQAISDKYVECSKKKQEIERQELELRRKMRNYMDGEEALTFKQYGDIKVALDCLYHESKELEVKLSVWDEARELCLNIADEMCDKED